MKEYKKKEREHKIKFKNQEVVTKDDKRRKDK